MVCRGGRDSPLGSPRTLRCRLRTKERNPTLHPTPVLQLFDSTANLGLASRNPGLAPPNPRPAQPSLRPARQRGVLSLAIFVSNLRFLGIVKLTYLDCSQEVRHGLKCHTSRRG
jgi:hypothetical protein